jgi:4,5-dihydroxyphthalate decarboxylase
MPALPMTFACGLYDRVLALQTGDIKPDGIDLNFLVIDNPREIFDRMSNGLEFDACEMSSSEYVSRLIPMSGAYSPTIAPASKTISAAPASFRSCI